MTEKQKRILHKALELFSEQGFANTSTASIAQEAGVSEGLIFRHFQNKDGLLNAILNLGKEKAEALLEPMAAITDPKLRLKTILSIPFELVESEYPFWRLLYALKWQTDHYDSSISNKIDDLLIQTFREMGFKEPELEAQLVMVLIDGLAAAILLKRLNEIKKTHQIILKKYQLSYVDSA
jgi:AcrR family transcriptional regulator